MTLNTLTSELSERVISSLERDFSGDVIRPGDRGYDEAREVWNAAVDGHPALIVRPRNASDVIQAVNFARAQDLQLAVRSGGHSAAGHGTVDGGVVIDLSGMKQLDLDSARSVAWAEPGLTWGEFNTQLHENGLATPGPDVAAVGLGGLTLGGGFGWLSRKHGMTIDNLLAAEVVTADGELVSASEETNPDLFWALRGGGGNFGIATRLQYQLHPVQTVIGGVLVYPASQEVVKDYAAAAAAASDELTTITFLRLAPPLPFIPAEAHGTPVHLIIACYLGDEESSQEAYAPLRNLGNRSPLVDTISPTPYPALFKLSDVAAERRPQAIRAALMPDIDETMIDAMIDAVPRATSPFSGIMLRVLGGAISCVPAEATAFSHRDTSIYFAINNAWGSEPGQEPDRHIAWTEELWRKLAPRTTGSYVNFLGNEGAERVRAAYSPETFSRLATIKRHYDPENFFRLNANIEPA